MILVRIVLIEEINTHRKILRKDKPKLLQPVKYIKIIKRTIL